MPTSSGRKGPTPWWWPPEPSPPHPWWGAGQARVVDVRDVLEGRAQPTGTVVVVDELGFHQATSVAELLADRGAQVEIATNAMVVGQVLGVTLDLETWNVKANAKGIRQSVDLVPMAVRPADGPDEAEAGRLVLTFQHHPTGRDEERICDWVVCSLHQQVVDGLWRALRSDPFPVYRVGDCLAPRRRPCRRHRGPPGGGGPVSGSPSPMRTPGPVLPEAVAVIVVQAGRLPSGADEAVSEAGGSAVLVGSDTEVGAAQLIAAERVWWRETGDGFAPGALAAELAPILSEVLLIVLPASADGRDLAPRLAARLDRPLLAGAERVGFEDSSVGPDTPPRIGAALSRLDDRILVDVAVDGPAVATLLLHRREVRSASGPAVMEPLGARSGTADSPNAGVGFDAAVEAVLEPDLATLDLSEARVVVAGGAGLAAGIDDEEAKRTFRPPRAGGQRSGRRRRGDTGGDRCRLDGLRAPDRHHRGDRRPRPLRGLRDLGRHPACGRPGLAPPCRERQRRRLVPHDGHGRSRTRMRRRGLLTELAVRLGVQDDAPPTVDSWPRCGRGANRWLRETLP